MSIDRFETLNRMIVEYIVIVDALKQKYPDKITETETRIYLDRELFEQLLNEKKFLDLTEKKRLWRSLNWISVDKNDGARYTKKIFANGKTFRKFVIEKAPCEALKKLTLGVGMF